MESVLIRAGSSSYRALIGSGIVANVGEAVAEILPRSRCALISDDVVARLWARKVTDSLGRAGFEPVLFTVARGEASKSLQSVAGICERMSEAGLDRSSFVVALGGGVIGDLAGFVSAVYHRGIPCVQIPTTLLAQVDSSIGGKTAVNTAIGKNLIGTVHHPILVVADVDTLTTLPTREFNQGFAEIIKHAIICDAEMLEKVAQASSLRSINGASWKLALLSLVRRNIEIKAAVVAADERDVTGERALLNFGHTIGHAIERASGYGRFLHGEAISLGIVAACEISVRKAGLSEDERTRVIAALETFGLPTRLPADGSKGAIIEATRFDKKFERGAVRFVVTPKLGSARVATDITAEDIRQAVAIL